jgi:Domain of unknown function (DUF4062)
MRIFISSTFIDLRAEREAAREALLRSELVPWGMELFLSQPSDPLDVCLRELRMSDAVVLIIGFRAGSLIPETPELTYTGAEFKLAQELGRKVFAFFKTEGGVPVNKETRPELHQALEDFKKAVKDASITPAYFDSPDRLQTELLLAMGNWNAQGRPGARLVFTTPSEFFAPFESGAPRLFDFKQTLRGRDAQLKALDAFLADPTAIVGVLSGRGGIGKSKLLHDWVQTVKIRTVVYVREDAEWHPEAAKEIPAGDVLIVADDAHRFDFLDRIMMLVRNLNPRQKAKLLLGTRLSGTGRIDASLSVRFDAAEVLRFPQLERVAAQSVRELALEVLGPAHAQYALALAVVSADTPLVTVVGGRLIVRGDIAPALLANEEDFRHQVFDRFSAEYERLLPSGAVDWRKLLNLVAALGPLSPTAASFVDPAAEILRIRGDEVRSALDLLERNGLLLRGGRLIRIVPDLLSDFLLEGACITGAGESTGYSDFVFTTFQSTYLSNILKNLGELDWRITQRNPDQGTRLLDGIWNEIESTFEAGDASLRVQLFKSLKEAALFQPARVLRLVRRALENEAATVQLWSDWAVMQEHVLREIPPLLKAISFHLDQIEEAARILWRLAKTDTRSRHQYPDHARRVLEEMAEYGRYKPVRFNDWMADFAGRMSRDPREFESSFTPLNIVDKLLAKEGEFTESEGLTISFGGFSLNYPAARPVREKALGIVETCLNADEPMVALGATKSISGVLSGFLPMIGHVVSEDEIKWQLDERLSVVSMIRNRLKKATPTPLLRQIRSVLRHARPHTKESSLGKRIEEVLSKIPQTEDLLMFDAFSTGQWDHDGFHENLEDADRSRRELITRGVAAFRTKFADGPRQVEGLVQLVKDAEECGIELGSNPYSFIEELCSQDFVRAFLAYSMNDSHPLLAQMVMVPLRWLRQSDLPRYQGAGVDAATHKNYLVAYGAANAVSYGPNLNTPCAEDVVILESLARHPAEAVRYLTFTGIRRLGAHEKYERKAIEMMLVSDVGDDSKMADEMCGAADYAGINKDHLSEEQIRLFLDKLVPTKEIDGHHTERLLAWVGEHYPAALFEFILRRLDRDADFDCRNEKKAGYSPIPHHRFGNAFRPLQHGPHYRTFLEQVRDRFVTQPEQGFWLRELFWSIGSIDATTLGAIDELVHRGDTESVRIALQLLGGAPPELALSRPHFAIHVTEECGHVEAQLGVSAESVLLTNAQTGSFNRASGQPSPKYLSMKKRSEALSTLFPQGSSGNRLFTRLRDIATEMLNRERLDDEQMGFE